MGEAEGCVGAGGEGRALGAGEEGSEREAAGLPLGMAEEPAEAEGFWAVGSVGAGREEGIAEGLAVGAAVEAGGMAASSVPMEGFDWPQL